MLSGLAKNNRRILIKSKPQSCRVESSCSHYPRLSLSLEGLQCSLKALGRRQLAITTVARLSSDVTEILWIKMAKECSLSQGRRYSHITNLNLSKARTRLMSLSRYRHNSIHTSLRHRRLRSSLRMHTLRETYNLRLFRTATSMRSRQVSSLTLTARKASALKK